MRLGSDDRGRAVARLARLLIAVDLDQLRKVDLFAKGHIHGPDVSGESVRRQFDAVCHPACQIVNEHLSVLAVTLPDEPARDELGVAVDGYPGPGPQSRARLGARL